MTVAETGMAEKTRGAIVGTFTRGSGRQAIWAVVSVLLAIYVSAVIMEMAGLDSAAAFGALYTGAIGQSERIFFFGTPLVLTGLSVALAFKTGLFNIGAEGQVYIGSMGAALMGYLVAFPIFVHPIVCLAVGAFTGGIWGFIPGLLKSYRGAHEVVTTMMLTYTAILFTNWLSSDIFREPNPFTNINQTPQILETAELPLLLEGFGGEYLHAGIILSVLAV
ncbi:MAG: ABC transporter permease, partial [Candidatus Thorarchaeota archaeon]